MPVPRAQRRDPRASTGATRRASRRAPVNKHCGRKGTAVIAERLNERATDVSTMFVPAPRGEPRAQARLRLHVDYGTGPGAVVHVVGEVDMTSSARLHELLHCRLRSNLRTLLVDLSGVTFMSIEGARALEYASNYARCHDKDFRVDLGGSEAAARVLRAIGLGQLDTPAIPRQQV